MRAETKTTRRAFLTALGAAVAGGAVAVGGYHYCAHMEPQSLSVERARVSLENLPPALEGLTLVQMSDFHLYPFTKIDLVRRAIDLTNDLGADLVLLTGDYVFAEPQAIFDLAPALADLEATLGVFSVLGNHDLWTDARMIESGLERAGIPVLLNRGMELQVGGQPLYVAGLDDGWSGHPDLGRALAHRSGDVPTILLMHEPDWADEVSRDGRVSLQLSGHSHGGQVRVPGIGAPILPRFGREYDQGLYRVGEMWLYTNRGIGVIAPPLRFRCPPEITEITLVRQS
ncbi:MAG: metallophosphoesterase [Chloroflexota bacterium]